MELTESIEQEIVSKIKESDTFKNAPTSRGLLQYLYDATRKGAHLKEAVIELEFFKSNQTDDKNNPRVRVNIYNLRKKLTTYYETEGSADGWHLKIDKGQYKVRFVEKKAPVVEQKTINWSRIIPYILLFIAIVTLVITNLPSSTPPLWSSFLNSGKSTNLILGDHFGAMGQTISGGKGWTRDFEINTVNEFYDLLDAKPELKGVLQPSKYSYTTRMAAMATQRLQQFFQEHNSKFSIRFSTQTTLPEIKEGNAIYAGPVKNENQFIRFFNEANPHFNLTARTLKLSNHPILKDTLLTFGGSRVDQEYAIVSKYPSIGNSDHFVFFSQHDIGVSATVEYFTNKDSLQKFQKEHLKGKKYFTALFKVKGQHRVNTDLNLEMVVGF